MTALFPMHEKSARLNAETIAVSRGDVTLFEGLSASVNAGDALWIQGSNGIGKTTLLEALAGLSRPDIGTINWQMEGADVTADRTVAYQPHLSCAKASLTAKEDLSFWAQIYGSTKDVAAALEAVGLSHRQGVPCQSLSAGQRKRLALAKLILSQKPIWIMDEPDAAMDTTGISLIDSLIAQHIARGGSAIIASHAEPRKIGAQTRKLTLRSPS